MKAVIVNAFERNNRGDAALLDVMISQVRQAFPQAEIVICGFEDPAAHPEVWGTRNLGSIRRYSADESIGRVRRMLRKSLVAAVALALAAGLGRRPAAALCRVLPRELAGELSAIASADLVVSLGGGYLHGGAGLDYDLSIGFLLLPLWIAERFGVPVVLGPQSFGPFPTRFQRLGVRRVLARAFAVSTREDISRAMLVECGVPERVLRRDVDSAFAFAPACERDWRAELEVPAGAELIVVTMRSYLEPAAQEAYEREMASGIERVLGADERRFVVLAPQVTCEFQDDDDRLVHRRVAQRIGRPRLVMIDDASVSHRDVYALYGCADLTVATRFHSAIFSLGQCVPCVVLNYANKGLGIMRELGFEQWVADMSSVTADWLVERVDRALADGDYRLGLQKAIPGYRAEVARFVEVLRSAVPAAAAPDASSAAPSDSPAKSDA
ncbi:MAG TPA: polysaccharide pyruvyl transferase family protein [Actinocrinis sp.]